MNRWTPVLLDIAWVLKMKRDYSPPAVSAQIRFLWRNPKHIPLPTQYIPLPTHLCVPSLLVTSTATVEWSYPVPPDYFCSLSKPIILEIIEIYFLHQVLMSCYTLTVYITTSLMSCYHPVHESSVQYPEQPSTEIPKHIVTIPRSHTAAQSTKSTAFPLDLRSSHFTPTWKLLGVSGGWSPAGRCALLQQLSINQEDVLGRPCGSLLSTPEQPSSLFFKDIPSGIFLAFLDTFRSEVW